MRRRLCIVVLVGLLALFGGRAMLLVGAAGTTDAAEAAEPAKLGPGERRAAMILGAGLRPDGTPSSLLADRIRAGERLLRDNKVDLLLMTGANPTADYNEPSAMRTMALRDGVRREQVAVDYGGRRTWDSCERARKVFGLRRVIVVSNDFHRARTVVSGEAAGLQVDGAVGTSTGRYALWKRGRWYGRELLASWRGAIDAWVRHPDVPVGGGRIAAYDQCAVQRSLSPDDRADPGGKPSGC